MNSFLVEGQVCLFNLDLSHLTLDLYLIRAHRASVLGIDCRELSRAVKRRLRIVVLHRPHLVASVSRVVPGRARREPVIDSVRLSRFFDFRLHGGLVLIVLFGLLLPLVLLLLLFEGIIVVLFGLRGVAWR